MSQALAPDWGADRPIEHEPVDRLLRALYEHLSDDFEIEYEPPHVRDQVRLGVSFQAIRPPQEVAGAVRNTRPRGNCIDLTLFLAGCLESVGAHPVILLTGPLGGTPDHAFLGCWVNGSDWGTGVCDLPELIRECVRSRELLVVEATGVCRGERQRSFDSACSRAAGLVEESEIHAIDVWRNRPPRGSIRPIGVLNDPVVHRAYWLADQFGNRKKAKAREAIHILYGLCAAGGELTQMLFGAADTAAEIATWIEDYVPEDSYTPRRSTNRFRACKSLATGFARSDGSSFVREGDLWWAILDVRSSNVEHAIRSIGSSIEEIRLLLEERHPRPGDTGSLDWQG